MKLAISLLILHLSSLAALVYFADDLPYVAFSVVLLAALITLGLIYRHQRQSHKIITTLTQGLERLADNDFSVSLSDSSHTQEQALIAQFNHTSEKLRHERQRIYQREMLLDKVINASPMVVILVDQQQNIVFANQGANQTFELEGSLISTHWPTLLRGLNDELSHALSQPGQSICSLTDSQGQTQAWHISCSTLRIHQATHQLFLFKSITDELSKQEIATWKKVISVISHELNNSFAPISSMCHSGELLASQLNEPRLNRVFNTISTRVNHLNDFVKGYAKLTKIPAPDKTQINWHELLASLKQLYTFELTSPLPQKTCYADASQLEQTLINLLKNATEASPQSPVMLAIKEEITQLTITITDQGQGMSDEVLKHASLPFYSTKHNGTGLGLALVKEIVDNHHGTLNFTNIKPHGLSVSVSFPF